MIEGEHNILIIDEVHSVLIDKLSEYTVRYCPDIAMGELSDALRDVTILIIRSKLTFSKSWIDQAPNLMLIGRLGSGMDNIDVEYAQQKGIQCLNAPEGNRNAVAEQTLGMMLSLLSNIHKGANQVSKGIWDRKGNEGVELRNLTVGIIGYGNVGRTVADKLSSFGCKILAYDRFVKDFGTENVEECSLDRIRSEADIVTLHVPLNNSSLEMIDSSFIDKMGKPFYLLNLSRGKVVNMGDIIYGLKKNKIRGTALDVLPNEKIETLSDKEQLEFDYVSNSERVIVTPHIGGLTKDAYYSLANVLANKVINWDINRPLVNSN